MFGASLLQRFALRFALSALQTNSRFSGAQIFLLHSGELHGQSGLLSCHGREENEEDEGCHRQPL